MPYSEELANRIRERFTELDNVEEKTMMGGWVVMYNGKMCVGIVGNELMCRIDPAQMEELVDKPGCRQMDMAGRPMKGYIIIDETGIQKQTDFNCWIDLALAYNPSAKSSKKKKR